MKRLLAACVVFGLAACTTTPDQPAAPPSAAKASAGSGAPKRSPYPPAKEDPSKRGHYTAGGLYAPHIADSAPDAEIDVSLIPEPEVVDEPRSAYGNRPVYTVLGKDYRVLDDHTGFVEQGLASYYGTKFHGRKTSNMEVYDMYAFTAAHKSLPLPSFARVTNLDNGSSVVVRVNDRGPFHEGRVIDLSYAAAIKLGITQAGTGRVEVRALRPGESGSTYAGTSADAAAEDVDTRTAEVPASTMDHLVAALPIGVAGAAELPPGARIATGKPRRMDGTTPVGEAATGSPQAAAAGEASWRFDMNQDGRTMTADEFDAWMRQRRVRVATGKPVAPLPAAAAPVAAPSPRPASTPVADGGDTITLQVASFAARANADRALEMLRGAGIGGAALHDATANGKRVWRLRVGPLSPAAAPALSTRIAGLGFGTPQTVRE